MTLTTIPKPEDRMEWKRARHPFLGASDAACLFGANPWKSLADLCVEKMAPDPEPEISSEAIDRGNRLEPFLLQWWGDNHGLEVVTPDRLFVCGRLMATLDGIPVGSEDDWIEAKTSNQRWSEVPEHVHHQVVAQAAATGRKRCYVVALDADMRFKEWVIEPTDDEVGDLLNRVEKFWDYLDLGLLPDDVEFGASHIQVLHPEDDGTAEELDEDGLSAVVRWAQARRDRLAAEKRESAAKDEVARLFGPASTLTYDGEPVATWKASAPRKWFDKKSFVAEHPELEQKFTVEKMGERRMLPAKGLDSE